jgi:hypothetical protein
MAAARPMARSGPVKIKLCTVQGQEAAAFVDGPCNPGTYSFSWDGCGKEGRRLSAGVYFLRMTTTGYARTRKIVML